VLGFVLLMIAFFSAMWAQMHNHGFKLGMINGVDEGLIVIWGTLLFTAIVG